VIVAEEQTDGKGQDTAKWESEKGKNLTLTIILTPHFIRPDQQFLLNKSITLAIKDFINKILPGQTVKIKWPNDIYIQNKKAAGILITNSILGSKFENAVIGIGININQTQFISDAPNPVSLKMISGKEYDLNDLLIELLDSFEQRYDQLYNYQFENINKEYHNSLYKLGVLKDYSYQGNIVSAVIKGTSEFGNLVLELQQGETIECGLKEIKYL
jgi:BirA family biotin operon repressor/biotin-[acetyl-CoA-carboxylase] ligase